MALSSVDDECGCQLMRELAAEDCADLASFRERFALFAEDARCWQHLVESGVPEGGSADEAVRAALMGLRARDPAALTGPDKHARTRVGAPRSQAEPACTSALRIISTRTISSRQAIASGRSAMRPLGRSASTSCST